MPMAIYTRSRGCFASLLTLKSGIFHPINSLCHGSKTVASWRGSRYDVMGLVECLAQLDFYGRYDQNIPTVYLTACLAITTTQKRS